MGESPCMNKSIIFFTAPNRESIPVRFSDSGTRYVFSPMKPLSDMKKGMGYTLIYIRISNFQSRLDVLKYFVDFNLYVIILFLNC